MAHEIEIVYTDGEKETLEGDYTIHGNCLSVQTYAKVMPVGVYETPQEEIVVVPLFGVIRINIMDKKEDNTRGLIV